MSIGSNWSISSLGLIEEIFHSRVLALMQIGLPLSLRKKKKNSTWKHILNSLGNMGAGAPWNQNLEFHDPSGLTSSFDIRGNWGLEDLVDPPTVTWLVGVSWEENLMVLPYRIKWNNENVLTASSATGCTLFKKTSRYAARASHLTD